MLKAKKNNKQEQAAASAPVIDVIIRYDGRSGDVVVGMMGGDLTYADLYALLEAARQNVQRQEAFEMQAQLQKAAAQPAPVSQAAGE